ncbi:MAG: histidinol-phosphatase [Cytophagales bacterium]|nr:histidinol-phosphatase [Armatimonadota bacterium]
MPPASTSTSGSGSSSEPIFFDYHSHHYRCGHAAGQMVDYLESAIARGMTEFGVSDHGPAYFLPGDHPLPGTQMAGSELSRYVDEALCHQEDYADRIAVKVGLEADFIEGQEAVLGRVLEAHPFDYVLGSVHYVGNASVFSRARWQTERAEDTYAEYYRLVQLAAASGLFDSLSHLTVIEAYGPPVGDDLVTRLYAPVARAVAASGCTVEINTSGYRKMGGDEPFPNRRMLRELIACGVPLTFGADSHRPDEVGFGRERAAALLHELGVRTDAPQRVSTRRGSLLAFRTR